MQRRWQRRASLLSYHTYKWSAPLNPTFSTRTLLFKNNPFHPCGRARLSRPPLLLGALGLLLCLLGATSASAQDARLLVRFRADCDPGCRTRLSAEHSAPGGRPLLRHPLPHAASASAAAPSAAAARLARTYLLPQVSPAQRQRLLAQPEVEWIEEDHIGHGAGLLWVPNDPDFPRQWSLEQPSDADVDALLAWGLSRGDPGVRIAILDTGITPRHPDLTLQLLPGRNVVDGSSDTTDGHGHGTHVASLIAAIADNQRGIVGLCPACTLIPIKVLTNDNWGYYSWWIEGLEEAVRRDASIANLSLGGTAYSRALHDAVRFAQDHGVIVVAAMMNEGNNVPYYPAAFSESIAVGATNADDQRASPFHWGGGSSFGPHIDLVAPGNLLLGSAIGGGTRLFSGTSQAAPLVSATLGLMRALQPDLTPAQARAILHATAEDQVGRPQEDREGFDPYHGHGRLNAFYALRALDLFPDDDLDGYPAPVDCDDTNPLVHPKATEIPGNGLDDDCDPRTPDGPSVLDPGGDDLLPMESQHGGSDCACAFGPPPPSPPLRALFTLLIPVSLLSFSRWRRILARAKGDGRERRRRHKEAHHDASSR